MKEHPYNYQNKSVWNKAYWNFTKDDWINWEQSFETFGDKYDKHIKSVKEMYK